MNNLTCWEHFFCTLIGVSSHHSPECVHACVCCACNVCIRSEAIYSIFFSLYCPISLFLSCVCMFSVWYGGWVLFGVFKFEFSFDLFSSLENRFQFGHFGWWAHRHTNTQAAKWQMDIRDKKRIYTTNRHFTYYADFGHIVIIIPIRRRTIEVIISKRQYSFIWALVLPISLFPCPSFFLLLFCKDFIFLELVVNDPQAMRVWIDAQ